MTDPIIRLAQLRVIKASRQLEIELANVKGSGPTLEILKRLKERAAESLAALPFLNVFDPKDRIKIVTLQNEVKRYDEWLTWMREIVNEGLAEERQMDEAEREELLDMIVATPEGEREAQELGLLDVARGHDA